MNAKSKLSDIAAAMSLVTETRATLVTNHTQEVEHERAKQEEIAAVNNRPRPNVELVAIWTQQRRQLVSLPGDAAERIARFSGIEGMLHLAKPPLASQMWPGGHGDQQVSPYAIEWILLQTPIVEQFTTELLAYLPADAPDVLPMDERQAMLAKLEDELAQIVERRLALEAELGALNFAPKEAAA